MLLTIFGGFLETLVIILVGYRLIGVSLKDKMIPICILSFYGSIILLMVKETLPSVTYLLVTILAIGFLLTFVTNLNSFASFIAVLLGCLLLLISEVIGFMLYKELPYIHSLSALPLVRPVSHLVIMVIFYVILRKANYYIPIPVKKNIIKTILFYLF